MLFLYSSLIIKDNGLIVSLLGITSLYLSIITSNIFNLKYLGLSDDQINTITKIVMPEMTAPADCSYMFYDCQYVQEIDFTGFD